MSHLLETIEQVRREVCALHAELTVDGRQPTRRVGVNCRWCPLSEHCDEGRSYLAGLEDIDNVN